MTGTYITERIDVDNLEAPTTHALNSEGWRGRVNRSAGEVIFQDEAGKFAIEARDEGEVWLWQVDGDEAKELAHATNLSSNEAALLVMDKLARDTHEFTSHDKDPEMGSGILPSHYQQNHAMFEGRWANGAHSCIGTAFYEDEAGLFAGEFWPNHGNVQTPWTAQLLRLHDDEEGKMVRADVLNETACIALLDVFMRHPTVFSSE